jgi:hypothetical protein
MLCNLASQPANRECLTAIWSGGRACKSCQRGCYRRGWGKSRVNADNEKRVAAILEK